MPERLSRRAVLAGAAALALGRPAAAAAAPDPGPALTALVRAEAQAAFVYLDTGMATVGEQEGEHARALAVHLQALGLPLPGPVRTRRGLPAPALAVFEARDPAARLRAAIAYEQSLIDGCAAALAQLDAPGTIRTVATVMAGHAQHQALHRRDAGLDPLSSGS